MAKQAISDDKLVQIKNRIHQKLKFYNNLGAYLIICTFLTFLDYFDKTEAGLYSIDWAYWVWLGWGIGVVFGFLKAFVYPEIEDKMLKKEIDKPD
jgi:2TM domain